MIVHVNTFGLSGIKGFFVDAEINLSKGLPNFEIIGMGNISVKEASGRIKPAIENMGYNFPLGRITVNLAPASIKKEGAHFDLSIAIGILKCSGYINSSINSFAFIGELSLDGYLRPVKGILPMVLSAIDKRIKNCIVPIENADEASLADDINIFPAASLNEVLYILENKRNPWVNYNIQIDNSSINYGDYVEVKGQQQAVRAAEISAAGGHNILFIGAAGCGKTMIASRMPGIIPKLTKKESMEVTPVYSVLGLLNNKNLIDSIPFRTVYPDVTKAGLIGGGNHPLPGEISLSHKGILFLDELAEFDRNIIQCLRQPIEIKKVLISRCGEYVEFPSDFILVAATNPCRCGKLLEGNNKCICTPIQAKQYLSRISKPILDRIDLHVPVRQVDIDNNCDCESSSIIYKRVEKARLIQKERYKGTSITLNGKLKGNEIEKYCRISDSCKDLLKLASKSSYTSMRGFDKCIKVARTIADIEDRENIIESDIAEALQYRFLDSFSFEN